MDDRPAEPAQPAQPDQPDQPAQPPRPSGADEPVTPAAPIRLGPRPPEMRPPRRPRPGSVWSRPAAAGVGPTAGTPAGPPPSWAPAPAPDGPRRPPPPRRTGLLVAAAVVVAVVLLGCLGVGVAAVMTGADADEAYAEGRCVRRSAERELRPVGCDRDDALTILARQDGTVDARRCPARTTSVFVHRDADATFLLCLAAR